MKMLGLFKRNKDQLKDAFWTDYKELDKCNGCGYLQTFYGFNGVCPECGSRNIRKVVGRWLTTKRCYGLHGEFIRHKSEVLEDHEADRVRS